LKINIVITGFGRARGTAGHEMLFGYANGLLDRGHDVAIITTIPSDRPQWYNLRAPIIQATEAPLLSAGLLTAIRFGRYRLGLTDKDSVKDTLTQVTSRLSPWTALPYRRASAIDRFRRAVRPADITMASAALTALPVFAYGTGAKVYFMQHYETYFAPESDPEWQHLYELEAELSYKLPLHRIANSTWLAKQVREHHGGEVDLCLNAFNHERFFPDGIRPDTPLTVVSYSGRGAKWKGFADAAEAIRMVRARIGEVRWRVFGAEAELPPENPIAPYEPIGTVDAAAIRRLYSEAHIALCPAWYESFPMYPMEAMACGCAVVTTQLGVEDYAQQERNALIVPARDSSAMANAIARLADDVELRARLVDQASQDIQAFTWERSLDRMEALLSKIHGACS
jgi:glycosyltransferase involved in cell wall biosynthesis